MLTAPRLCELCGRGFINRKALRAHCYMERGNWNEYRKRLFWEAEKFPALPLDPQTKRNRLASFSHKLVYSTPGSGGKPEPRREEACVVCAHKGWLEQRYRAYVWKTIPEGLAPESEGGSEEDDGNAGGERSRKETHQRGLLRDSDGDYYFGDPREINKHIRVSKYAEKMPLIPLEHLRASSIQHPQCPEYLWVLHTRRLKVKHRTSHWRRHMEGGWRAPALRWSRR